MNIDKLTAGRIIGKKPITAIWEKMYDVTTWRGTKKNIVKNKFPLRYTPSGRPMFFVHELIAIDQKFQEIILENMKKK